MKICSLVFAFAACCVGPSQALSATSHGATTLELVQSMDVFCTQARVDSGDLGVPMTSELKVLCS